MVWECEEKILAEIGKRRNCFDLQRKEKHKGIQWSSLLSTVQMLVFLSSSSFYPCGDPIVVGCWYLLVLSGLVNHALSPCYSKGGRSVDHWQQQHLGAYHNYRYLRPVIDLWNRNWHFSSVPKGFVLTFMSEQRCSKWLITVDLDLIFFKGTKLDHSNYISWLISQDFTGPHRLSPVWILRRLTCLQGLLALGVEIRR